ncbi:MAG: acyl-CoA thioesterase [Rhizobiaceae bacterium]|nr:acyl-CoA thioesterase [Rhizobiaceae bacterium]
MSSVRQSTPPAMQMRIVSRHLQPHLTIMTLTQTPTFLHRIEITPGDIDDMDHVNNAVYLRWVQEAVVHYWQQISSADAQQGLLWVALKHEIVYRMPLLLNDQVDALVTATGTRGSRASFSTNFRRGDDIAAEVQSSWCCIDANTRRPQRIARDIVRQFLAV